MYYVIMKKPDNNADCEDIDLGNDILEERCVYHDQ